MKLNAYTVFDTKAFVYRVPFFAVNHSVAIRSLSDAVNDPTTVLHQHPADFKLYCCGVYDDATGTLVSISPHEHVRDAITLVKLEPQLPLEVRANGSAEPRLELPKGTL